MPWGENVFRDISCRRTPLYMFGKVPRPSFEIFGLSYKRKLNLQPVDSLFFLVPMNHNFYD